MARPASSWCPILALVAGLMLGCGGDTPQPAPAKVSPDVYVAGWLDMGGNDAAMLWKNGQPMPLTDGTRQARAFAVTASGGDIYVAGVQYNAGGAVVPTIWKNGSPVALGFDGFAGGVAESIVVSGSDVYAAGYLQSSDGASFVAYWKNGVPTNLSNYTFGTGEATAIAVSGSDVYVAGWSYETVVDSSNNSFLGPVAKLWKNGQCLWLNNLAIESATAQSLAVAGSDVYVVGYSAPWSATSSPYVAKYWMNGTPVALSDGIHGAKAFALALAINRVAVAGFTTDGGAPMATLWVDGQPTRWTSGSSTALLVDLAIPEGTTDTYAVGSLDNVPRLWVNGVGRALTDGSRPAEARSVCVVPR